MNSSLATTKPQPTTAPTDLDSPSVSRENEKRVDFCSYRPKPKTEVTIELEYATKTFPLEGDRKLHAAKPLRFAYVDDAGTVEICGWDLKVNLDEATDLPRQISRRFIDLFAKAERGDLDEQEEACFDNICEQIDYRRFCADRDMPRYMEALVLRKTPALIRYLGGANIRLEPEIARKIELLDEGEYFGAYFTLDREGQITDIRNVSPVPSPEEILANDTPDAYRLNTDDFPDSLRSLLPGRNQEKD